MAFHIFSVFVQYAHVESGDCLYNTLSMPSKRKESCQRSAIVIFNLLPCLLLCYKIYHLSGVIITMIVWSSQTKNWTMESLNSLLSMQHWRERKKDLLTPSQNTVI